MNLIIDNHIIDTDLEIILNEIRKLTNKEEQKMIKQLLKVSKMDL